ncbi:MAG: DNA alkylation repair protein [Verrucomicrobiota bacterium]|jgi:3-methyladenine DNA glycosylase AlkD
MTLNIDSIIGELHGLANPENVAGMARFGIIGKRVLGISVGQLRALAKRIGHNQGVAEGLWSAGIFEARLLAAFVAEPAKVTRRQANAWAKDFECWADCDGLCIHLFRKTPFAHELALAWSRRREELVKRAGFTMMATLAVHDKKAGDEVFHGYLDRVLAESADERHNVKKGVNWALRQIGKRNRRLNREAIRVAKQIQQQDSRAARWIASDALRELNRWA